MSARKRKEISRAGRAQDVFKMLRTAKKSSEPLEFADSGDQIIAESAANSCEIAYRSYCEKAKEQKRGLSVAEMRPGKAHRSRSTTPEPQLDAEMPTRSRTRLDANAMAYIERLKILTSTIDLRREDYSNLVSIVRAHGLHESPRVSLAALSLLDRMSKVHPPMKMGDGLEGPMLLVNLQSWLPLSWEKKEHRGEKRRESLLSKSAYDVEHIGELLPEDEILTSLVTALHSVDSRPADVKRAYGDVLLLRHVVKLLALDLRLRIRLFSLRSASCESRATLLCNSLLWCLYAEPSADTLQSADTRRDIIKMLAEVIGRAVQPCEVNESKGRQCTTASASNTTESFACGPAECASLAQQLLMLILELLGAAEEAQLYDTDYVSTRLGNLRAELDDWLFRLLTGYIVDKLGHESKLRTLAQKAALLSALQPVDRLRALSVVVAKRKVQARKWDCCRRMDEVLQQLEHHADSKKVQSFVSFSTLDVLEYLRQEAAQPNDHHQRVLPGDSGSPDGLALLLSSIAGTEMEKEQAQRGAPQDGYAAALKSTTLTVMNALLEGHVNLQKGKSTLVQPAVASVTAVIAMLEAQ